MTQFKTPADLEDAARTLRPYARRAMAEKVGWVPHPGQKRILTNPARHRVASCGRRFGKSVVGGVELLGEMLITDALLPEIQHGRRREFWVVGPNYMNRPRSSECCGTSRSS